MHRMHRLGDHVHNGYCAGATHGGRVRATLLIDGHGREGSRTRALGVKHTAAPNTDGHGSDDSQHVNTRANRQ